MHLAAVMGLVIEHMCDQKPLRLGQLRLHRVGVPPEVAGERCAVEPSGPVEHDRVERGAFAFQVAPVVVERYRLRNAACRRRRSGKPAHPDTVGPEQMVERGVDRAEEGAALAPPLGVGKDIGGAIKVLVLPVVIASHALHIADIDHGFTRPTADGRRGKKGRTLPLRRPSSDGHAAIAPLAFSTMAAKAAGSWIARSDSTLRSTSRPALPSPSMNRL